MEPFCKQLFSKMSSEGWPIVLMMRLTPVCADSRRAGKWEEREEGQCKRRPERREIPFVRHCQSRCAWDTDCQSRCAWDTDCHHCTPDICYNHHNRWLCKHLAKCKIFQLERKTTALHINFTHSFVARQFLSQIYTLSSVKFLGLQLQ